VRPFPGCLRLLRRAPQSADLYRAWFWNEIAHLEIFSRAPVARTCPRIRLNKSNQRRSRTAGGTRMLRARRGRNLRFSQRLASTPLSGPIGCGTRQDLDIRTRSPCMSAEAVNRPIVFAKPFLDRIPYFSELLEAATDDDFTDLRRAEATGRPLGMEDFVVGLEKLLGHPIARRAPGRRTSSEVEQNQQMDLP